MPDIFISPANHKKKINIAPNIFSTFIEKPNNVYFRGQHEKEHIILLLRKHWVTNIGWLIIAFLLLLTPIISIPFFDLVNFLPFSIPLSLVLVGTAFWYLGTFGYILINFLFWFFNVNIITNERIIDADFVYLLYNEITSTIIPKIEDVTYKRAGFFSALFDYGNVFVQTAGTEPNIEFLSVPKPATVTRIITKLMQGRI